MAEIFVATMHPYIAASSNRGERLCSQKVKGNLRKALEE